MKVLVSLFNPENLENIPLEYFLNGLQWLKRHPEVQKGNIHLYGPSRGGELALLLACHYPKEIASVVAVVPSCVAYGGIPNEKTAAWTFQGNPIFFAPTPGRTEVYQQLEKQKSVVLTDLFLDKMEDKAAFEKAFIIAEKYANTSRIL